MTRPVVDASATISWLFEDEARPSLDALGMELVRTGMIVPPLWHIEVAHILLKGERRGRSTVAQTDISLRAIERFAIETDRECEQRLEAVVSLARHHRLTVYDATYLELAIRRKAPLATLDKALVAAARQTGLTVLP